MSALESVSAVTTSAATNGDCAMLYFTNMLALGDSPNDQPLLEAGDLSVVVPGANGPHPVFADAIALGRYKLAPACHAQGWAEAVFQHVLNESR